MASSIILRKYQRVLVSYGTMTDDLQALFEHDFDEALVLSELKIIGKCPCYEDFVRLNQEKQKHCVCQKTWNKHTLVVQCKECKKDSFSCICLECYFNSNHVDHHVSLNRSESGGCDCGVSMNWAPNGFCDNHIQHHQTQLDDEVYQSIYNVFKALFSSLHLYCIYDSSRMKLAIDFISKFKEINESFEKAIVDAFINNFQIDFLLGDFNNLPNESCALFKDLINKFASSQDFMNYFALCYIKSYPKIAQSALFVSTLGKTVSRNFHSNVSIFNSLQWYCLYQNSIDYVYSQNQIIWINLFVELMNKLLHVFEKHRNDLFWKSSDARSIFYFLDVISNCISKYVDSDFLDKILDILKNNEFRCPFWRITDKKENLKDNHYSINQRLTWMFSSMLDKLTSHYNGCDIVFKRLVELIDSQNEDEFSISSTLSPLTKISLSLNLHQAYGMMIMKSHDFSDMSRAICIYPIKFFAAFYQIRFGVFVKNSDDIRTAFELISHPSSVQIIILPLFALIQLALGASHDQDNLIYSICSIFGVFEEHFDDKELQENIFFSCIYFITCLITDRITLSNDKTQFLEGYLTSILLTKNQMKSSELKSFCTENMVENPCFNDVLNKISTQDGSLRKIKDFKAKHFIYPWMNYKNILDISNKFLPSKNLIPFPEFIDSCEGLNFASALITKTMFCLEYVILSDYINDRNSQHLVSVHFVLNLLTLSFNIVNQPLMKTKQEKLVANSLSELKNLIPEYLDQFMFTPIEYKGRETLSVMSMIEKLEIDTVFTPYRKNEEEQVNINKQRAEQAKLNALRQIQMKNITINENDEDECSICRMEENENCLCYPIYLMNSIIPSVFNEEREVRSSFVMNLCNHPVHMQCCSNWNSRFYCKVCRSKRNNFLPKLQESFDAQLTESQQDALSFFFNHISYESALNSFIDMIRMLEIRERTKKDFMNKETYKILFYHLFRALYHYKRLNNIKHEQIVDSQLDKELVIKLIESKNPLKYLNEITNKDSLLYRRATIIKNYICNESNCVYNNQQAFKPWRIELPNDFVQLALPPFNCPIEDQANHLGYCLITKTVFAFPDGYGCDTTYDDYIDILQESPSLVLVIAGRDVSDLQIITKRESKPIKLGSVYLNIDGEDDIGFEHHDPLSLNNELLEKQIDYFITGEWVSRE